MKRVLVLSGGGSKGAYEVGVVKYLVNVLHREYDAICGISVGALNGAFLAQYPKSQLSQGINDLEQFWLSIKTKNIYKKWFGWPLSLPWKPSVYNSKPLHDLIQKHLNVGKLINSGVDLWTGAVSLSSGHIHYYNTSFNPNLVPDWVEASAAFPLMLTPVKIANPNEWYIDGGVRDVTPLNVGINKAKGTHFDVVIAQNYFEGRATAKPNLVKDAPFILSVMMNEIIENDLQRAYLYNDILEEIPNFAGKRTLELNVIRPMGTLNHDPLTFKPIQAAKDINLGFEDAKKFFEGNYGL